MIFENCQCENHCCHWTACDYTLMSIVNDNPSVLCFCAQWTMNAVKILIA